MDRTLVAAHAPAPAAVHPEARVAVPCAARPATGYRHYDGPCRCFVGGPAPEFPPARRPGTRPAAA